MKNHVNRGLAVEEKIALVVAYCRYDHGNENEIYEEHTCMQIDRPMCQSNVEMQKRQKSYSYGNLSGQTNLNPNDTLNVPTANF